jgi:ppGpp synthetase/RelA/SpoT-type nucleotidyltranferase
MTARGARAAALAITEVRDTFGSMDLEAYERERRRDYADFAAVVALILDAAIRNDPRLRLQQVKHRAKEPSSLRKKLEDRDLGHTTTLEDEIKDLAGCRVIFYTNSDVARFINSGAVQANFEVTEVRVHYPQPEVDKTTELYISNHYVVRLRPARLALPEYERFVGMRCEVQVQTILNHAWAEMAHDTIYKAPTLDAFGHRALEDVERRLERVARNYLVPAGYEFQKIVGDFERLLEGKELFDRNALEAVVSSADNNTRAETLEAFIENVLPHYDDIPSEYPHIVRQLVEAVRLSRGTTPHSIETPYGLLPAKTAADIVGLVAKVLETYRYADVDVTFDAVCQLFAGAECDDEREALFGVADALCKHELEVWQTHGPAVQSMVIDRIGALPTERRRSLLTLLARMLNGVLDAEITGTTWSTTAITMHFGAVQVSDELRSVRGRAIALLSELMGLAASDRERRAVLHALDNATRGPRDRGYPADLATLLAEDTIEVVEYLTEVVPTLSYEIRQTREDRVRWIYIRHRSLPETLTSSAPLVDAKKRLLAAALAFRDALNADREFVIYKTLVGFKSVFPPAWDDPEFDITAVDDYRAEQVEVLLGEIDETSADRWFEILSRCAQTESNDLATFPTFGRFLTRLGEAKPDILIGYIERMGPRLARFLPAMLSGLMKSTRAEDTRELIERWLAENRYLSDIAWYCQFAEPGDEALLTRVLEHAVAGNDALAVLNVLAAAERQFRASPGRLIETAFLPALRYLISQNDLRWVSSSAPWLRSPILRALDEDQAAIVLKALVPVPELGHNAEYIAAAIAERWPGKVIDFLDARRSYGEEGPDGYRPFPSSVHTLRAPLAANLEALVAASRRWFAADEYLFRFRGGRFLASIFPDLPEDLRHSLAGRLAEGDPRDIAFVLAIVSNYAGKAVAHGVLKEVIAQIDPDDALVHEVDAVLSSTGVVAGEFGLVDFCIKQKVQMQEWLTDPRNRVRTFAKAYIRKLDLRIADEQRRAETSIAMRKLRYGEDLSGEDKG